MFLLNSRYPQFCATLSNLFNKALLLPKLRSYFAEFLQRYYLKRLSILYPITCVGLQYGILQKSLIFCQVFSRKIKLLLNNSFNILQKFNFFHLNLYIFLTNTTILYDNRLIVRYRFTLCRLSVQRNL